MKQLFHIFTITIIQVTLISCGNTLPQNACECNTSISDLSEKIKQIRNEILPYDSAVKKKYKSLLADLIELANSYDITAEHCNPIFEKEGHCEDKETSDTPFWDCGHYVSRTDGISKYYQEQYTGNWLADSLRNSIANVDVAEQVLFSIWYKEESGSSALSDFELLVKDSLERNYNRQLQTKDTSKTSGNLFPGM